MRSPIFMNSGLRTILSPTCASGSEARKRVCPNTSSFRSRPRGLWTAWMIQGSAPLHERQQGSRAYVSPSGEAVSMGWDWWSLGIVVIEVVTGRNPFRIGGEWLSDPAISDLLSQGSVDVSEVTDPDLQRLCRGLLLRRTDDRWGADEVRRWLRGEKVPIVADTVPSSRTHWVLFNGHEYQHPADLALGLQEDWDKALEELIQRNDGGNLSQQVTLLLSSYGLHDAELLLREITDPPSRLANLLVQMRDDLLPVYRGVDIRRCVGGSTDDPTVGRMRFRLSKQRYGLATVGVMSSWRTLAGMETAPLVELLLKAARCS